MTDIGIYEVQFDESTNEFVLNEQLSDKRLRRDTVGEIIALIQSDMDDVVSNQSS